MFDSTTKKPVGYIIWLGMGRVVWGSSSQLSSDLDSYVHAKSGDGEYVWMICDREEIVSRLVADDILK